MNGAKKVLYDWSLVEAGPFSAHVGYPPTLVIAEVEDHALKFLYQKSFNLKISFVQLGFSMKLTNFSPVQY